MRIGFLLNHDGAHQVGHALPIALAMAGAHRAEVSIYVSSGAAEQEVRRTISGAAGKLSLTTLKEPGLAGRLVSALSRDSIPGRRVSVLSRSRDLFRNLDALVVPEKTSLRLKTHYGLTQLPLIHTRHGAGDRAVGFNKASGDFDLVLLSGAKIRDRLQQAGLLKPDGYAIVGYPKFDALRNSPEPRRIFANDRPIVMYNPHVSPALSSWYSIGPAVLEYFAAQRDFNVVFAPHVMLFAARYHAAVSPFGFSKVPAIAEHLRRLPHIHLDTGSAASVDMTYTRMGDIYLGDASSQIYEFLARPRPCIFLNPRRLAWQDDPDFMHWTTGPVVEDLEGLDRALKQAVAQPDAWRDVQERLFAYTFDLKPEPSAERAATAIIEWLGRHGHQ